MRNLLVVGRHRKIVADFLDENFGQDVLIHVRQKSAARPRFQPPDAAKRGLNVLDFAARAAGDFRDAALAERVHVIANNPVFERILPARAFELQHEAFAQIYRADAGRIEGLDNLDDPGDFLDWQIGRS